MKKLLVVSIASLIYVGILLPAAHATPYYSEGDWLSALGAITPVTEDFDGVSAGTVIPYGQAGGGLDLGAFSLWEIGNTDLNAPWYTINGSDFNGLQVDGTNYVQGYARSVANDSSFDTTLLDVRFDDGITAWGAYFDNRDGSDMTLQLEFRNYGQNPGDPSVAVAIETFTLGSNTADPGFFGVILDDSFQIARVSTPGMGTTGVTNQFGMDNMSYGAPVPEPASMFLLGSGLIGLAGLGRRKFRR